MPTSRNSSLPPLSLPHSNRLFRSSRTAFSPITPISPLTPSTPHSRHRFRRKTPVRAYQELQKILVGDKQRSNASTPSGERISEFSARETVQSLQSPEPETVEYAPQYADHESLRAFQGEMEHWRRVNRRKFRKLKRMYCVEGSKDTRRDGINSSEVLNRTWGGHSVARSMKTTAQSTQLSAASFAAETTVTTTASKSPTHPAAPRHQFTHNAHLRYKQQQCTNSDTKPHWYDLHHSKVHRIQLTRSPSFLLSDTYWKMQPVEERGLHYFWDRDERGRKVKRDIWNGEATEEDHGDGKARVTEGGESVGQQFAPHRTAEPRTEQKRTTSAPVSTTSYADTHLDTSTIRTFTFDTPATPQTLPTTTSYADTTPTAITSADQLLSLPQIQSFIKKNFHIKYSRVRFQCDEHLITQFLEDFSCLKALPWHERNRPQMMHAFRDMVYRQYRVDERIRMFVTRSLRQNVCPDLTLVMKSIDVAREVGGEDLAMTR